MITMSFVKILCNSLDRIINPSPTKPTQSIWLETQPILMSLLAPSWTMTKLDSLSSNHLYVVKLVNKAFFKKIPCLQLVVNCKTA